MELLPPEMVEAVAGWLDFRDRVRLSGVCWHLRRNAFRGCPINLGDSLRVFDASFPSFLASLETAVHYGAYFRRVSFMEFFDEQPDNREELMDLIIKSEAKEPKLLYLELHLAFDNVPDMSVFTALRGLKLIDCNSGFATMAQGFDALALADLPALQILDIIDTISPTLAQLNLIPIQRLTDLHVMTMSSQTWLDSLPCLPHLRSLRLTNEGPYFHMLDFSKVPGLRWLEGDFVLDGIGQLSRLERCLRFSVDEGEEEGPVSALLAVLANPDRPPGLPLYVNTISRRKGDLERGLSKVRPSVNGFPFHWYTGGDVPKGFHCVEADWLGHAW